MATCHLKYVITGCGGSATGWGYRMARGLGSACGHQGYYTTRGIQARDDLDGDSSWCAVPHIDDTVPVLWLVRDPLSVVRSLSQLHPFMDDGCTDPASKYVRQHRPGVWGARDRLGRILRYVAAWDAPVEAHGNVFRLPVDMAGLGLFAAAFTHVLGRHVSWREAEPVVEKTGGQFNTHHGKRSWINWDHIRGHPDGAPVVQRAEALGYGFDPGR